ncbi:MAG: hypothetical protein K8R39_01395 [Arcobacteraceae bacterium]|nr:hypothetical protein [Arcobacteraceae bacterium]
MFINIKSFLILFWLIVVAYLSTSMIALVLPKKGIDFQNKNAFINTSHKNVDLENIFLDTNSNNNSQSQKNIKLLNSVTLLAIYDLGKDGGYIVMKEKVSSKTLILEKNEFYEGYKLIQVLKKYALFEKFQKRYKLPLEIEKI